MGQKRPGLPGPPAAPRLPVGVPARSVHQGKPGAPVAMHLFGTKQTWSLPNLDAAESFSLKVYLN